MFKFYRPTNKPINQGFGKQHTLPNMLAFYVSLGILGHNGHDYACPYNTPFYFGGQRGLIECIYWDTLGGNSLQIIEEYGGKIYRHLYFHLKDTVVKVGQMVETGDKLGHTDNTGTGTTGNHLHYGIKEVVKDQFGNYQTINKDNGYKGCLDLALYDQGIYVVDFMNMLNSQLGLLQQIINLIKKLFNK